MADVALVRLKAGGKFYEVGDEVPKQDDMADLKERGLVGSPNEAKKLLEAKEAAEGELADAQAEVERLQAEVDSLRLENVRAAENTESVTDAEAAKIGK